LKRSVKFVAGSCMVVLLASCTTASVWSAERQRGKPVDLPERPPVLSPITWTLLAEPVVAVLGSDDHFHVAYELLINNVSQGDVQIEAIEAIDPNADDTVVGENHVVALTGEDVTEQVRLFSHPSKMDSSNYSSLIGPGQGGIVYMNLMFSSELDIPDVIAHRVKVSRSDAEGAPETTTVGALTEIQFSPVVISPPLRGDRWLDGSGCCTIISPHRFTVLPVNGAERVPKHFAVDFVQLDDEGHAFTGDLTVLDNWHFYGADVVAAAGGKVVTVVDGFPDQVPGALPVGITAETAAGNHVVIDMHDGRYAVYAHLIPGSIAVEEGDVVRMGQLLGQLGNSGNTDGPHLHFHIMTDPSPLETVGLPFVFDRMQLQGRLVGSMADVADELFSGTPPVIDHSDDGLRRRQMPVTLDLLGFN
jgi:Peptidase family M23